MVTDCSRHDVEGRTIVKLSVVSKILEIVLLPLTDSEINFQSTCLEDNVGNWYDVWTNANMMQLSATILHHSCIFLNERTWFEYNSDCLIIQEWN